MFGGDLGVPPGPGMGGRPPVAYVTPSRLAARRTSQAHWDHARSAASLAMPRGAGRALALVPEDEV